MGQQPFSVTQGYSFYFDMVGIYKCDNWLNIEKYIQLCIFLLTNKNIELNCNISSITGDTKEIILDNNTYTAYMTLTETDMTLPIELYETSFTPSVYCNEMALYWIQTWIPKLMVMIVEVIGKKLGIKLPKTNNTSEQGNKIYGNDIDARTTAGRFINEIIERGG